MPWYAWLGGFYGAFFVAVAAFAAPRVGVGVLLTAAVAGQLAAALVLDHFGLLGLDRHPVTLTRAAGFVLVLVGAVLVGRARLAPLDPRREPVPLAFARQPPPRSARPSA